jgi:hypothetical protein
VQDTPQEPGDLSCWTHLTRSFTAQEVQDGGAGRECRLNLQEDLEATQIRYLHHRENRRKMRNARVPLATLEQLVGRIFGDQSHPSSTDSFGASQGPHGGSYTYTRHRSRRHSRRREEENARYNQKRSQVQDPDYRSSQNLPQSCYSGNEEGEYSHRQARQFEQRFEYLAGSQQSTLQGRTQDAREPRQVSPSYSPSHERAEGRRPRRQSELRYDDYAAPELRDPVARKTRRSHPNDERPEDYVSAPRRSFSTNGDEDLGTNWHVPPIQQVASNLQSAHSSQPREDNPELDRTTSEGEQPYFKRKLRQPSNRERDDHQSEQRARHREVSTSRREQATNYESVRPHTPDESNPRLPPNVYHQRLREQRNRDTSRTHLPLSSSKYSTHNATKTNSEIPSKHNPALQKDDCLPRTRNFDGDHLQRHSSTSRRRSPSRSSSTSEASRGSYDTCFSTSSSLSSHSTLVPEPFERQPPRQESRYYPPDSYQPPTGRRRRRKSSRGRSSSSRRHRD